MEDGPINPSTQEAHNPETFSNRYSSRKFNTDSRIRWYDFLFVISSNIALANASASPGGTNKPFFPCSINSAIVPTLVDTGIAKAATPSTIEKREALHIRSHNVYSGIAEKTCEFRLIANKKHLFVESS